MARTRTLDSLRDEVRARTDTAYDPNVTDDDVTRWVNQGIARVHDMLVHADPDSAYSTSTFSTVPDQEAYTVPADLMALRGVDVVVNGERYPLRPLTFQERLGTTGALEGWQGEPAMRYQLRGRGADGSLARLYFDPAPRRAYSILLHYVTTAPSLASGNDAYDGVDGWEDYVVLFAACAVLQRQDRSTSDVRADMADAQRRIEKLASLRDMGEESVIADVRRPARRRWGSRF